MRIRTDDYQYEYRSENLGRVTNIILNITSDVLVIYTQAIRDVFMEMLRVI